MARWNLKGLAVRYGYLLRLILIVFAALCVPFVAAQYMITRNTYEQIRHQNMENHAQSSFQFSSYFDGLLYQITEHAYRVRSDRILVPENIKSHIYNRVEAVQALDSYAAMLPAVSRFGLYLRDTDIVVTSTFGYTRRQYITMGYAGESTTLYDSLDRVLTDGWAEDYTLLSSFNTFSPQTAKMLIAKPIKLGIDTGNNAMLLYEFNAASFISVLNGVMGGKQYHMAIYRDGVPVFMDSGFYRTLTADPAFTAWLADEHAAPFYYEADGVGHWAFKTWNPKLGQVFVTAVPDSIIMQNVDRIYESTQRLLMGVVLVLTLFAALVVYLSYQPVQALLKGIRGSGPAAAPAEGEFRTINRTIEDMRRQNVEISETMAEQQLLLMDYMLGNVLYGLSVKEGDAGLFPELAGRDYFVLAIRGLDLDNQQREELALQAREQMGVVAYAADIPHENHTVIILAKPPPEDAGVVAQKLRLFLETRHSQNYIVGAGGVVDSVNQLRDSYIAALAKLEESAAALYAQQLDGVKGGSIYADERIARLLQCVQNGFDEEALALLDAICGDIEDAGFLYQKKYSYYELLSSYLHLLHGINLPPENSIYVELISFESGEGLRKRLGEHIIQVCESIRQSHQDSNSRLKRLLLDYANENFTDPGLTLMKVSDQFRMSVYTCSRLFKEAMGIGFKEYVTARRMELAKNLLLTTEKSIYEITSAVGFENSTYFITRFKANYGVSPNKFRKNLSP